MGIFGLGREDWDQNSADLSLESFLKERGFSIFTFNGKYFIDENQDKYGAWGDIYSTERKDRVQGGYNHHFVIRGVRQINTEEDLFLITHDRASCYCGGFQTWNEIHFINRCPVKGHYDAVVVTPGATWREDGQDGGAQKIIYTLLMLKTRVKRGIEFRRDETPEEKRLREIEVSMPVF